MRRILFSCLLALPLSAAEWQFAVETGVRNGHAFLWIPPACQHVRGVILGQQVILEKTVFEDTAIRHAATEECLAEVIVYPGFDTVFHYGPNSGAPPVEGVLQSTLDRLAEISGYTELASAPWLPIGHSGSGIFAWNLAYWKPRRTIALIGLHSAAIHPPAWDPKATVDGVPVLGISGQYESWGNPNQSLEMHWRWLRGTLLEMRAMWERPLMSILVDPGGGHFSFNPPLAQATALFIRKAAHYRIPAEGPSLPLREIPSNTGWLSDSHSCAPFKDYRGDRSLAFWHLDEELARSALHFAPGAPGKRDQRVTFVQNGQPIPAAWLEDIPFQPMEEGLSVRVSAAFLSETPKGVADSGKPLGHASGAIQFRLIGGWAGGGEQTGPETFRIRPSHFGATDNLMVLAYHPGDRSFAWTEQAGQIKYPKRNNAGRPQTITFPAIPDQASGTATVALHAQSDSGLPVEYYVAAGPAEMEGHTLRFTAIPPRSRFPVKVTVVAYQWGRSIAPLVQSAAEVAQSFLVLPNAR